MTTTEEHLIKLYQQLAGLTNAECRKCPAPLSCCDADYCDMAIAYAKDSWGVDIVATDHFKFPCMGSDGCTVAPHLRPLCTFHACEISSLGFKKNDPEWTKKYWELRNEIDTLEYKRNQSGL